jgi:hypothetical protein
VYHVYKKAGVEFAGFKYCLKDGIVDVDSDLCNKNTDITKEEVEEGDLLSVRYYDTIHNIIFLRWIDQSLGKAEVFDWIGQISESKFDVSTRKFRSFETTLKFDEKSEDWTVYAIGKSVI